MRLCTGRLSCTERTDLAAKQQCTCCPCRCTSRWAWHPRWRRVPVGTQGAGARRRNEHAGHTYMPYGGHRRRPFEGERERGGCARGNPGDGVEGFRLRRHVSGGVDKTTHEKHRENCSFEQFSLRETRTKKNPGNLPRRLTHISVQRA